MQTFTDNLRRYCVYVANVNYLSQYLVIKLSLQNVRKNINIYAQSRQVYDRFTPNKLNCQIKINAKTHLYIRPVERSSIFIHVQKGITLIYWTFWDNALDRIDRAIQYKWINKQQRLDNVKRNSQKS